MDVLGHNRISVTMNTYAHVMPLAIVDATNIMNSVLTRRK
jgi:hypothetical protein